MFITQEEIERRLTSDENLLVSLFKDSPKTNNCEPLSNGDETSVNISSSSSKENEEDTEDDEDDPDEDQNDIKLAKIVDYAQSNDNRDIDYTRGRPKGSNGKSTEQRSDFALMGAVLGNSLAADILGVSTSQTSLHGKGLITHGHEVDVDLDITVKRKLTTIRHKAANSLIKVLDNADNSQLYDQIKTAKDAVFVANSLAGVIQKVMPKEEEQKPTAQFVIIQPTVKTVEQYEVINV